MIKSDIISDELEVGPLEMLYQPYPSSKPESGSRIISPTDFSTSVIQSPQPPAELGLAELLCRGHVDVSTLWRGLMLIFSVIFN